MKTILQLIFLSLLSVLSINANGVGIINAEIGSYLLLTDSQVDVSVDNQIAIIKTTQSFSNLTGDSTNVKYSFPLPASASAIELRYYINGLWYKANIAAQPQDSTFGGGGEMNNNLREYLGETPLFFDIEQTLQKDSSLTVELTYVELLGYEFGEVNFVYPNNYSLIQYNPLNEQGFHFFLQSERSIENISLLSHQKGLLTNSGHTAQVDYSAENSNADRDFEISYVLSLDELGLFGFSTFQPDSLIPDAYGKGYFTFIAEPDAGETTEVIDKTFTFIIDRSGSMSGGKIVQAKNAAKFIVENLNQGDRFNIVDFASSATSFRSDHVEYNQQNLNDALNYISGINSGGGTYIGDAFSLAIPQFASAPENNANIILFFTDGHGSMSTEQLLAHVKNLVDQYELELSIFTFGIGGSNRQLLTQLATENNGTSAFLEDSELEEVITNFYSEIRSPVLLNTQIEFSSNNIEEVLPNPLPNLYKGQQMIVSGRYSNPGDVTVTLNGEAFGEPVQYQYTLSLSDSSVQNYQFIPKVWAKRKIKNLLVQYYSLDPSDEEAEILKAQIVEYSMSYGIITEFTSFSGGTLTDIEEEMIERNETMQKDFQLLGNYPNPFNPSTKIRFYVGDNFNDVVKIRIYNSLGQLVNTLYVTVNGAGTYEVTWNGDFFDGRKASTGMYVYVVDFGNRMLSSKMLLIK